MEIDEQLLLALEKKIKHQLEVHKKLINHPNEAEQAEFIKVNNAILNECKRLDIHRYSCMEALQVTSEASFAEVISSFARVISDLYYLSLRTDSLQELSIQQFIGLQFSLISLPMWDLEFTTLGNYPESKRVESSDRCSQILALLPVTQDLTVTAFKLNESKILKEFLPNFMRVQKLTLNNCKVCQIDPQNLDLFFETLAQNKKLESLTFNSEYFRLLESNFLKDNPSKFRRFLDGLSGIKNLKSLTFYFCEIDNLQDKHFGEFLNTISQMHHITSFSMKYINDEKGYKFDALLSFIKNSAYEEFELNIAHCRLSKDMEEQLHEAIKNSSIQKAKIYSDYFGYFIFDRVQLKLNSTSQP